MSYCKGKMKKEKKSEEKQLQQNMILFYSLEIICLILPDLMRNPYKIEINWSKRCTQHLEKSIFCFQIRYMVIGNLLCINTTSRSQMLQKINSVKMHCLFLIWIIKELSEGINECCLFFKHMKGFVIYKIEQICSIFFVLSTISSTLVIIGVAPTKRDYLN